MASAAPQPLPPVPRSTSRTSASLFGGVIGDDIFVSYSRADGISYAEGLAAELTQRGFSCRVDLWETQPGIEMPASLTHRIRRSKMLVVVGTEGAQKSVNVHLEIEIFLQTKSMLVPIALQSGIEHASWFSLIQGLPIAVENDPHALVTGKPSESVVSRIENAARFTRRNRRLRNMAVVSLTTFLLLAALSFWFAERARRAGIALSVAAAQADTARKDATAQTAIAKDARKDARDALRDAGAARKDAEAQQQAANKARQSTQLEVAGIDVLRQFNSGSSELDALQSAVSVSEQLRRFAPATDVPALPVVSPILALNQTVFGIREKMRLDTNQSPLRQVVLSRQGVIAVFQGDTFVNGGTVVVLWTLTGQRLHSWTLPKGGLNQAAFSADGTKLFTACGGSVQAWTLSGELLNQWGNSFRVEQSLDSQRFVILRNDRTATLVVQNGARKVELQPGNAGVSMVRLNPSNDSLITSGNDHSLRLWQSDGTPKKFFEAQQGYPSDFAYTPDGKFVVATFSDGVTYTLDPVTGKVQYRWNSHAEVASLRMSPTSDFLGTVGRDGVARLWFIDGSLQAQFIAHRGGVQDLHFSPDGNQVITTGNDGTIVLWTTSGAQITTLRGHHGRVTAAYFAPDAHTMVSSALDDSVKIWDLQDHLESFSSVSQALLDIAPSRNGSGFLALHRDGLRIWNAAGVLLSEKKLDDADPDATRFGRISPNQQLLLVARRNGVMLYTAGGRLLRRLSSPFDGKVIQSDTTIVQAVFNRSGSYAAILRAGGGLELHNLNSGLRTDVFHSTGGWVFGAAFDPSGQRLLTSWADGKVRIFHLDGRLERQFDTGQRQTLDLAISPDGTLIAAAGADATLRTFTIQGTPVDTFSGGSDRLLAVKFSKTGQLIAARGDDGVVHVWLSTGQLLADLTGTDSAVNKEVQGGDFGASPFSFSAEEKTLAIGGKEGAIKLWPVADLDQLLLRGRTWLKTSRSIH